MEKDKMWFVWVNIPLIYSSETPSNSKTIQMPIIDPCANQGVLARTELKHLVLIANGFSAQLVFDSNNYISYVL